MSNILRKPQATSVSDQARQPEPAQKSSWVEKIKALVLFEPYLPLKCVSFFLLWLYLPFRLANAQGQWYVGALAYLVTFLIVFKYTDIVRFDYITGVQYSILHALVYAL